MEKVIIVGDLFPTENNISYFSGGDARSLFGDKICKMFADANFRICNLEGSLTDHIERCCKTGPVKVASTSAVNAYKKLGIDCCMLANNHATDGGHRGMLDTMGVLDNVGIQYVGAGKNKDEIVKCVIRPIGGMNICFYNVCETMYNKPTVNRAGAWLYDEYIVCNDIKEIKQKCDYIVVIYHGGIEKFEYPSPEVRKRFHRMVDSGADMVLSQHTHCIGSEEHYKGAYLLYGQGAFLLKNFKPGMTDKGLMIELQIQDKQIRLRKHLVRSDKNLFVRYDEAQNLQDFEQRSLMLQDEDFLKSSWEEFCKSELRLYLSAFKSPSKLHRLQRRFFPKQYEKWLYSEAFSARDLMFVLHTLRSEQNRETAICGLENLLAKN